MAGLALTADLLVAELLGDAWVSVGGLILLLAPFGLLQALSVVNTSLLLGIGQSGLEFRMASLRAVCVAAGILIGLRGGTEGVAAWVSAGFSIATVFYMRAVLRAGRISLHELLRMASAPVIACAVLVFGVIALRMAALDRMMLTSTLLISIMSGILIYISVLFFGFRSSLDGGLSVIRHIRQKNRYKSM
jgi:O-antigen/teichoic acid export membrane protein